MPESKMKLLTKRMGENSIKLRRGLCCGSGAGASATLSSAQGVTSQAGMAVFAGRHVAGHSGSTAPTRTTRVLQALGRKEASPAELIPVRETCMGCHLPQRTDFMSWGLEVKGSSTDHVWPRLRAKVCTRSREVPCNRLAVFATSAII